MLQPFYDHGGIRVYQGDVRKVLPQLDLSEVTCILADPPYGETTLKWDRWPNDWPSSLAEETRQASLWCFGSMRMFLEQAAEFKDWRFSHEVVWEKQNGSGFAKDRFKRVHEFAVLWYRGRWPDLWKQPVYTYGHKPVKVSRSKAGPQHAGHIVKGHYESTGERLARSVLRVRSEHGRAKHPTQKPIGIIDPLVRYSARPGSVVLDLFSGYGTGLVVAKQLGLRAIGIEGDPEWCAAIAGRLTETMAYPAPAPRRSAHG